jgi:16S rRNA processing protein RimM
MDPNAWIPLAEVARPHGVKGELRLKLFNKDSDVLLGLEEVLVRMPDGEEHEVSIDEARRADQAILMKLYSIDDRDRADEVRGALLCARRRDFPELEDGEFYTCDLVDARVTLLASEGVEARDLGNVRDVKSYPSVEVLVVRGNDGGGDWEIPLVANYVAKVDVAAQLVEIAHLEGVERDPPKDERARAARARGAARDAARGVVRDSDPAKEK